MEDDNNTRITLRLPKSLHSKLQDAADATSKSMNAEIIARLESSFAGGDPSALITAIAHLNVAIRRSELELQQSELMASLLASSLKEASEFIITHLEAGDETAQMLADKFAKLALPYLGRQQEMESIFLVKMDHLARAIAEVRKTELPPSPIPGGPMDVESPVLPKIRRDIAKPDKKKA